MFFFFHCKAFSSSLQWLLVSDGETRPHEEQARASSTPTYSTWHCQEPSQNTTQMIPVVPHRKQKQAVTNILTSRTWKPWWGPERRAWNAKRIQRNGKYVLRWTSLRQSELYWRAKVKVIKSHTLAGAGQIPISSPHMLCTNVNAELMREVGQSHIGSETACRQSVLTSWR